jgi:hypothetical protein
MDKIYYINDLGYQNGYLKFDNHRLPQAYMEIFPWYSLSWDTVENEIKGDNNIIIVQTPTNNELKCLQIIDKLVDNNKVFLNQESSIFDWFDWPAPEQQLYIKILSKSQAFLYHSEHDKEIMKIFIDKFIKYPGCINFTVSSPKLFNQNQYVIIPNPVKRYQRGMITHKLVTDVLPKEEVYGMAYNYPSQSYNLAFPDKYQIKNIKLLPRVNFNEWMGLINGAKFGVDIHREFSGGNVSLEFGALGVPLIGNINLDSQRDIFPDLSFDYKDYDNIKKFIKLLNEDKDFYEEISKKALYNTQNLYNSNKIVEDFRKEFIKFI